MRERQGRIHDSVGLGILGRIMLVCFHTPWNCSRGSPYALEMGLI